METIQDKPELNDTITFLKLRPRNVYKNPLRLYICHYNPEVVYCSEHTKHGYEDPGEEDRLLPWFIAMNNLEGAHPNRPIDRTIGSKLGSQKDGVRSAIEGALNKQRNKLQKLRLTASFHPFI